MGKNGYSILSDNTSRQSEQHIWSLYFMYTIQCTCIQIFFYFSDLRNVPLRSFLPCPAQSWSCLSGWSSVSLAPLHGRTASDTSVIISLSQTSMKSSLSPPLERWTPPSQMHSVSSKKCSLVLSPKPLVVLWVIHTACGLVALFRWYIFHTAVIHKFFGSWKIFVIYKLTKIFSTGINAYSILYNHVHGAHLMWMKPLLHAKFMWIMVYSY